MRYHEKFLTKILNQGKIPEHIAFIMDGNRRYAKFSGNSQAKGHAAGFSKLIVVMEWCLYLGIKMMTIYAFSIDNFQRSRSEVQNLMELAEKKFQELLKEGDLIEKYQVQIRVFGDIELLPFSLQVAIAKVVRFSRSYSNYILNVCFAYTAEEEMMQATQKLTDAVKSRCLEPCDITEHLFNLCLYSRGIPDPDLLIRTSGESRLSNFMLWQINCSHLSFVKSLWPDFSFRDFFFVILEYQRSWQLLKTERDESRMLSNLTHKNDIESILNDEELMCKCLSKTKRTDYDRKTNINRFLEDQNVRIERFLQKQQKIIDEKIDRICLSNS